MTSTTPEVETYPQRGRSFFVNRFMAYVLRSGVALQFGCEAVALLLSVALTEDKTRYSKPVQFWNDQLTAYLGCRVDRLNQIRKRLVDAGWLHYEAGRKSVAGRYWVLVPGGDERLNDAVLGDNVVDSPTENFPDGKAHTKAHRKPDDKAHHKPSPFLPVPIPVPNTNTKSDSVGNENEDAEQESTKGRSNRKNPFGRVTLPTLCDTAALLHLFEGQSLIPRTNENRVWFVAIAEKSIDPEVNVTNRVGLFVTLARDLAKDDRSKIGDTHYDRAKLRLRGAPTERPVRRGDGEPVSVGDVVARMVEVGP